MSQLKTTPKDVFLHLLMMVMLYIGVISLITISFAYVDYLYPDFLKYYPEGILNNIRHSSSMLIVSFPLLLLFSWLIQRDFRRDPEKHDLKFRKWLVYLTLFVAAITIIIELIQVVYHFYGGELTIPFALKVVSVLILAGAVFSYYLWDVQHEPHKSKVPTTVGWISSFMVIGMLALGFLVVGSPVKQREVRMDEQRISDLQALQAEIINYWQYKDSLPSALDDLKNDITGFVSPNDPETKKPYEYEEMELLKFKLCATFNHPNPYRDYQKRSEEPIPYNYYQERMGSVSQTWDHESGTKCFERTIDPALFDPTLFPKPVRY